MENLESIAAALNLSIEQVKRELEEREYTDADDISLSWADCPKCGNRLIGGDGFCHCLVCDFKSESQDSDPDIEYEKEQDRWFVAAYPNSWNADRRMKAGQKQKLCAVCLRWRWSDRRCADFQEEANQPMPCKQDG